MNTKEEMYMDELEEKIKRLNDENVNLQLWVNEFKNNCEILLNENRFLKQRNKELRQKTWFQVYEENLKLQEQVEKYAHTVVENVHLREELEHYKDIVKSVEIFLHQQSNKKGDKSCH